MWGDPSGIFAPLEAALAGQSRLLLAADLPAAREAMISAPATALMLLSDRQGPMDGMGQMEITETWWLLTVVRSLADRAGGAALGQLPAIRQAAYECLRNVLPEGHSGKMMWQSGAIQEFGGGFLWYLDRYETSYCVSKR
jgi:hypothetical protein